MLNLNGKDLPSFVLVNSVEFSVLPPIQNNLLDAKGKAGTYLMSQKLDTRIFTVQFTLIADEINGVMSASRELADWLYHDEPVKLVFDDEPDKYYMVIPDGETNISETVNIGQGEITFICTEPFAFGDSKEESFELRKDNDVAEMTVEGTVETHPIIEMYMMEDATSVSLISDNQEMILGEPADVSQIPTEPEPIVTQIEEMEEKDIDEWENPYTGVDGGVVQGKFETNDYSFRQRDKNYGSADRWHGASMVRDIERPLQDFRIHLGMQFIHTAKHQVGRIELYLLDEEGFQFGKISMVDRKAGREENVLEARAGTWSEGTYFASGKNMEQWHNGYGRMVIKREGRQWTASTSPKTGGDIANGGGVYDDDYKVTWFDSEDRWNHKLAKIQIHIGAYGSNEPVGDMAISHITVRERLTLEEDEAPIIAIKNDKFLIDNEKMVVYLNDEPRFDLINPASNFIKFKKGKNHLTVSPSNADLNVSYKERWL